MENNHKKPNILLILCDQMRGDCLGAAEHPVVKTPYLDTLAADGVLLSNAYSACPSCIPARAALFTGMSQQRHGRVGYRDGVDWDYTAMLPALLRDAGYATSCAGKLHAHPPLLRCGFEELRLHDGYIGYYRDPAKPYIQHQNAHDDYLAFLKDRHGFAADVMDTGIECNAWIARPWIYDEMSHPTNWATSETLRMLARRDRTRPFFHMLSYVRPHPPWDAPQPYFTMYENSTPRPAFGDWADPDAPAKYGGRFDSPNGTADAELRRQGMLGYYACITHMDHQIGRVLKALDEEGTLEDTLVLFLSDHGEMLFDHGLFRKVVPYQGSVQIPFLLRPGKNLGLAPIGTDAPVELRDVAPTLLELAGCPKPGGMDGVSLLPLLRGESLAPRRTLHGEHSGGPLSNHYIVTQRDKYIWFSQTGREQYFDLVADPREEHDLIDAPACAGRIADLRGKLVQALENRPEGYVEGGRLVAGRPPLDLLPQANSREGWA